MRSISIRELAIIGESNPEHSVTIINDLGQFELGNIRFRRLNSGKVNPDWIGAIRTIKGNKREGIYHADTIVRILD